MVKILKQTLTLTLRSQEKLNYCEMETLLISGCNMANEMPLTVRVFDEHTFHLISVNQLLLGRTGTSIASIRYANAGSALERLEFKEVLENVWWKQFYAQVFPSLDPLSKWKETYPNRKVGDVVLVHYPCIKKAEYRLARVSRILPDQKDKVRTIEVLMRPWDKCTDGSARYVHKDLEPLILPVQRVALIMPAVEVEEEDSVETQHVHIHREFPTVGPALVHHSHHQEGEISVHTTIVDIQTADGVVSASCSSRCTVCSACRPTSRSAIVITMSLNVTPVISSLKGGRLICLMCGDLFYPSRFIGFGSSDKKYSTYHTSLPSFSLDFILKRVKASLSKPR